MFANSIHKEKGQVTLPALLLLLTLSILLLSFAYTRHLILAQYHQRFHLALCVQKLYRLEKQLILTQNQFNRALRGSIAIQIIFPASNLSLYQMKQLIRSMQQVAIVSYLNNLQILTQRGCPLSRTEYKTPYQLNSLGLLIRNSRGETVLRTHQWRTTLRKNNIEASLVLSVQSEVSSNIKYKTGWKEWPNPKFL